MKYLPILLIVLAGTGCGDHYDRLEEKYKSKVPLNIESVQSNSISIVNQQHTSIFNSDFVIVGVGPQHIDISHYYPLKLFFGDVSVPSKDVYGCSISCFKNDMRNTNLLLADIGTKLSIKNTSALVDWCWSNKLPIVPYKVEKDWLYKQVSLPNRSEFSGQFKSRDEYDYLVARSCNGY